MADKKSENAVEATMIDDIKDSGSDRQKDFIPNQNFQGKTDDEVKELKKRLLRKVDYRVMPMLIVLFLLNILDRNNFTNARLGGLEDDLGLSDHQYNTCLMIMYVGYLLFQFPSNLILSNFPRPGLYLSVAAVLWGAISTCMAATHTFGQALAVRFFLGFAEAPFFPGALLMLSSWYAKDELPFRIAILYAGNTISNCFGGLIAAGVLGGMNDAAGIHSWRWLFILEGCFTIGVALLAGLLLPNYPKDVKWLTDEEREYAIWRLSTEVAGQDDGEDDKSVWYGGLLALKDPKVYMLILIQFSLNTGMAYTYFFPSIVKTLGYNKVVTLLLTAPPYAFAFFGSLGNSIHAGKTNERAFHIAIPMAISMIGNVLCISLTSTGGRYFAMYLMTLGVYSAFNVVYSWVSATIPRPRSKRAAALAMVNIMGNSTHLFTSYLYPDSDKPRYARAGITLALFCGLGGVSAIALRYWLRHENRKLDRLEGTVGDDAENPNARKGFRYII
ncbi:putative allantoate permease protein [Neofusicoccum parvum UCRNP2]|uniref:Major facilitator superfamily n=2 Tax=Neofusicoccum parvum TaxID=310453 RepID=A0ACB5S075_9PEZI|nr:putative allantoate permease protein [Neofusicoccum parvum UCRNP2]GME26179.1 Major facilitator superfamily [Neofusicoccum parvum]